METTHTTVDLLNDLVEINNDRIEGYETAIKETDERDLRDLFADMAAHSRTFKNELSAEVRRLGGSPTEGTRNDGKLYRIWMDIKAALTGKDKKAIVSSCEFGEDAALEAYNDVLKSNGELPNDIRLVILREKEQIQRDHDRIKSLRDSIK